MSARSSSLLYGVVHNAGSFLTSLHATDSISAVTFTISLWRSVTNPPVLHANAWSMFCFALQKHSCDKRLSSHSYLNKRTHFKLMRNFHVLMVKMITILKHRLMLLCHWLLIVLASF